MIIKIHKVRDPRRSNSYLNKGDQSTVVDSTFSNIAEGFTGVQRNIKIFETLANQATRSDIKNIAVHISLSMSPKDRHIDALRLIALNRIAIEKLYGDVEYFSVIHLDRPHLHIHTVASTYTADAKPICRTFDYNRAKSICRELEELCKAVTPPKRKSEKNINHKVSHANIHGYKLVISNFWKILDAARDSSCNLSDYINKAHSKGIRIRIRNKNGIADGITYSTILQQPLKNYSKAKGNHGAEKFIISGKKLGAAYMLPALVAQFNRNLEASQQNNQLALIKKIEQALKSSNTLFELEEKLNGLDISTKRDSKSNLSFIDNSQNVAVFEHQLATSANEWFAQLVSRHLIDQEQALRKNVRVRSSEGVSIDPINNPKNTASLSHFGL